MNTLSNLVTSTAATEAGLNTSFHTSIAEVVSLATSASEAFGQPLSDTTAKLYGLITSVNASDGISKLSGAELASTVEKLLEAYYGGNKSALTPIIEATNLLIDVKHAGVVKTANIPNNLRLLVSRKSAIAAENAGSKVKLVLSAEGNSKATKVIVIKGVDIKTSSKKSVAQKQFESFSKFDALDHEELARLIASDANLLKYYAILGTVADTKKEASAHTTVTNLEVRRNTAADREDKLQDILDQAGELKLKLVDEANDLEDKKAVLIAQAKNLSGSIKDLEAAISRCRKEDTKAAKEEELEIARVALAEASEEMDFTDKLMTGLAVKIEKAVSKLNKADEAYSNQAHLVVAIGKEISKAKAELA